MLEFLIGVILLLVVATTPFLPGGGGVGRNPPLSNEATAAMKKFLDEQ